MKFYPPPIIRFCYRYLMLGLFVVYPLYFTIVEAFDANLVAVGDRPYALVFGFAILTTGCIIMNCVFLEKCFSTLVLTDTRICWKCPLRKTRVIPLSRCAEIGAYLENADNGIPIEQIYFSDHPYPQRHMGKNGVIKPSQHLIKFWYSEQLYKYLMKNYPSKYTSCLNAYCQQRKKSQ